MAGISSEVEQVVNGIASLLPPSFDSDDDEYATELYGKYTWKIMKFSQTNPRELRSNAFEVGGYKWYILIYPHGCDVTDHISLFICVADHDKLLPGWSHSAQFTVSVVNKDPKKSKYSDTLHRFWKKEHDWGWKKYIISSELLDGFLDDDILTIKAQIQVIRERADRPFRCLFVDYRRELLRVYLSNVENIYRRFLEERKRRFKMLIEDNDKWSSFCSFWSGISKDSQHQMSSERSDLILKEVVKHFFIEKQVTSTLVMESLYSGLRVLESKRKRKDEEMIPLVSIEKGEFVLVDDVLRLLERAAMEPSSPNDETDTVNHTTDDFSMESFQSLEKRLAELGRETIEIFVLAHIFRKIQVAKEEEVIR